MEIDEDNLRIKLDLSIKLRF